MGVRMELIRCYNCETEFERRTGLSKPRLYCSRKCKNQKWYASHRNNKLRQAREKRKKRIGVKVCPTCRTKFRTTDSKRKFCDSHYKKSVKERRRNLKQRAVTYKGGKCKFCGYSRCIGALKFHHPDPRQKDFSIGAGGALSWERIVVELDKCILVCGNCHDEIHAGLIVVV
jgi:hypothetical protein